MKKLIVLTAMLPLSACISFGAEPPPSLLALNSTATVPVGETRTGQAGSITIREPTAPQEIAVERVPVRSSDTSIAYVKDAQWVEPPARLFARLLSDTVSARTGRLVLSRRQSATDPGAILAGELRRFGVEAAGQEAVVTYDATLLRGGADSFEKRRFEARVPVAAVEATTVGVALNQAANDVAVQVADWVGR